MRSARTWLVLLAGAHALLAAAGWARATGWGTRVPDLVGGAFAVLSTLIAGGVLVAVQLPWSRGRFARLAVVGVALLVPLQVFFGARSERPRIRFNDGAFTGMIATDDGAFRFALGLAEPFRAHHGAVIDLERVADGRRWRLPLPLRRSARDAYTPTVPWGRMSAIDGTRYWLSVSTAMARPGPQYFVVDSAADPPRVEPVDRGLTRLDGRAQWDCAAWPVAPDRTADDVCGPSGLLPPERACLLDRLAVTCGPELAATIGRCPTWAAAAPRALACLQERTRAGDPHATDARLAVLLEERSSAAALALIDEAAAAEAQRDPECAAPRRAARRVAAGRRLRAGGAWLNGLSELAAATPPARCADAPLVAPELRRPGDEHEWEAATIERRWGDARQACARAARIDPARLPVEARREAEAWRAACAEFR